jgi:putative membrane protein
MDGKTRKRSIVRGALAGLIGGIAGSGAKMVAEAVLPPRVNGQTSPPVALVERAAGHPLSGAERDVAEQAIHWTFGALAGAVYGAAVEISPAAAAWRGAAFGLMLNRLTHRRLLSKMGLAVPVEFQSTQERQSEWVTHAVYGVVTDAVRRGVRKGLD